MYCDSTGLQAPSGLCEAGYYCVSGKIYLYTVWWIRYIYILYGG